MSTLPIMSVIKRCFELTYKSTPPPESSIERLFLNT